MFIRITSLALGPSYDCPWTSYQIRKIAGCACTGYAGNVFPSGRLQRKPLANDPGMHHGTCVTHVPWCMSGSLTRGGEENVPGIPGACTPAILCIWQETHETVWNTRKMSAHDRANPSHDGALKWKHFPRYWPFVRGIHQWPLDSLHNGSMIRGFDVSFDVSLRKLLNKQLKTGEIRCLGGHLMSL